MKDEIDTSTSSGLCKKIFHNFKLSIKNFAKYFYGQGLLTKVSTFIAGLGVIIAAILGGNQIIQEIIKTKQIKNEIQIQLSVGDRFFEQYEYERAIIEYNKILEIDNNNIENAVRPLALGRKNYLFAGSDQAAQHAAMMYSFFASCKANNINPYSWLNDVLNRLPEYKANKIEELLPHNWTHEKS